MKLTSELLKKIIAEEVAKFGDMESTEDRASEAEELEAAELGSDKALEKKIDYIKALKIEESRLRRRLKQVVETRARVLRSI
jgi:hypothetical protein